MTCLKRSDILEELRLAQEESRHLSEMIKLLGHTLDTSHVRQLRIELLVVNKRMARLGTELMSLDSTAVA